MKVFCSEAVLRSGICATLIYCYPYEERNAENSRVARKDWAVTRTLEYLDFQYFSANGIEVPMGN